MKTRAVSRLLLAALVAAAGIAIAADAPKPLYTQTIAKYPAPKLEGVGGREYKFLIDPAKAKGTPEEAFKAIWTQVKAAAAKTGFTVTEKEKNPLKIEMSTKEYFDTPDQALWNKGYLVRITTKYKDGKADETVAVTVKAIMDDALKTLATPARRRGTSRPRPRPKATSAPLPPAVSSRSSRRARRSPSSPPTSAR